MICNICLATCKVTVLRVKGTLVVLGATCINGHRRVWSSQPLHKKMPLGNLLIAASIFFSGSSGTKTILMLKNMNVVFFSLRTFNNIQAAYLLKSVDNVWKKCQQTLLHSRKNKRLILGGDGRCCSPGHTAKYGSYSVMDLKTSEVLDMQLIQVRIYAIFLHSIYDKTSKSTS